MAMRKVSNNGTSSGGESYDFADGLSEASSASLQEQPPGAQKWRAGCFAKYKLGSCTDPQCTRLHDLNPSEICSYLTCLEQTHHRIFPDSSSETPGARGSSDPSGMEQHRCMSERLEYEDLQKSLRERFRGMSEAAFLATLPLTKSGSPSSMGSVLHASGKCRPCRNVFMPGGCPNGVRCLFCHQEHSALSQLVESHLSCVDEHGDPEQDGNSGKPERFRPSKAKRDQYKQMVKDLEDEIMKDPFGWSIDSVAIPPTIASKPSVKKKLLIRLAMTADTARSSQMQHKSNEAEKDPSTDGNPKKKDRSRQLIAL